MAGKFKVQLTPKQMQVVVGATLALVGGGFVYFSYFWKPISARIAKAKTDIEAAEAKITKARAQAARLPQIQQELVVLNQQAADAEKRLPKTKDVPEVIDTVSSLSRKNNVQMTSFVPGAQSAKPFFMEVPYTLSVTGSYHNLGRFFAALALEERIFNVRNVTYGGLAEGRLSVSFTLVSYQYKG